MRLEPKPIGAGSNKERHIVTATFWVQDGRYHVATEFCEAFELADRVVILGGGEVQQTGAPHQLRDKPANTFVAEFIDIAA